MARAMHVLDTTPWNARLMQRTREELEALLRQSEEELKKSDRSLRRLKTVMTKVNKVVGPKRSVKRKPPR